MSELDVIKQALAEIRHAQNSGADWYTRGHNGLYMQVRLWLDKADKAIKDIEDNTPVKSDEKLDEELKDIFLDLGVNGDWDFVDEVKDAVRQFHRMHLADAPVDTTLTKKKVIEVIYKATFKCGSIVNGVKMVPEDELIAAIGGME